MRITEEGFPLITIREIMQLQRIKHANVIDLLNIFLERGKDKWLNFEKL